MAMSDEVFDKLAEALDRLPNGFPRTRSNAEIPLLKKIFSREEAGLAAELGREMTSLDLIAEKVGLPAERVGEALVGMAKRGLLWSHKVGGDLCFRLAPFIVGIYEAQLGTMDAEFAALFERYMEDGGAAGMMKPEPALHRVLPVQDVVRTDWILPYDDVRAIVESAKAFRLRGCICRVQQDFLGQRRCDFPIDACLILSTVDRPASPDDIPVKEALAVIDESERLGLVHTASNVIAGISYICNCCGCCCGILRGINDWGLEGSVARTNYYAVVRADKCTGCGICVDRCQVGAVSLDDEAAAVDLQRCIGCGLCVTGCPSQAIELVLRPDAEIKDPPADFADWERQRLINRGLAAS
jgi:NAD-dependent dihydropyrimidine dehydrogenase PreA subunit